MLIVSIVVFFAILLAIYVISGTFVPYFLVGRRSSEDLLDGRVVAKTNFGSLIRLDDGSLCFLKTVLEPDTQVLVTLTSDSSDDSDNAYDPETNCVLLNRAVLDPKGQRADVIRRVSDDTVVCEMAYGVVLVEALCEEQANSNKFDDDLNLYLLVRPEGVRMIPLCDWYTVKSKKGLH